MSRSRARTAAGLAGGLGLAGLAGVAYSATIGLTRWTLRTARVPVLDPGSAPFTILHLSDMHMLPSHSSKQEWVRSLDLLDPDLVVVTGDNLAHVDAVPSVVDALGGLLRRPGLFVFGSNDYYGPIPKSPTRYLTGRALRRGGPPLPWRDLRDAMTGAGWLDLTNSRTSVDLAGRRLEVSGVDDPHLHRDRYDDVAGPVGAADIHLGLSHSPEPRVLDRFTADGFELILCGHTHGGQLRVPGYGALVTNCGLDRARCRGLCEYTPGAWLNVSAGLGTSPYTPVRFACPPEASLLTLTTRG